ncbi:MAG TPA: potassium transporter Kup [Steroidobacteraceae bacterium]|nr:potassium transporter Kup [Steroidobacteraceae bacterium]
MHARSAVADTRSDANAKLVLTALGVVFGDIGTSPLYAFRETLNPEHGIAVTQQNIIGILSLILWSLVLIISIKYVAIVLRADNRGEGGVLALSTLLSSASKNWRIWGPVGALGVFGAALFFGDGFITPAISVLSAMEGLAVATPRLEHFVLPGAIIILTALFMVQRRGAGAMGRIFGPVTLVWFATLALLGIRWIVTKPDVVFAINPLYAVHFFMNNGWAGFVTLASVFLAVTGGEALYADLGHFGRSPIRRGWFVIVLPALVLNYFGQGALLLEHPGAISNPFYLMAPGWLLPLIIVLATAATVIASQAVISGVFSIARQALNLGYLPRLRVLHSSEDEIGQVYVPTLNWMLFAGTMTLILVFQSSSALAGAYGIAISSTMLIDSILVIMLLRVQQQPRRGLLMALLTFIVLVELAFFLSNLLKFDDGGWLPIAVAIVAYVLMTTWQEGRRTLNWLVAKEQMPVRDFLAMIEREPPHRVEGVAVYLASEAGGVPRALLNNLKFNRVLHERNVLLTFVRPEVPFVSAEDRVEIQNLGEGLCRIIARYGFMETPNVVAALRAAEEAGVPYEPEQTVYVVGRENPIFAVGSGMPLWRKRLFAFMGRNSQLAAIHFGVPSHRLLEVSSLVRL